MIETESERNTDEEINHSLRMMAEAWARAVMLKCKVEWLSEQAVAQNVEMAAQMAALSDPET